MNHLLKCLLVFNCLFLFKSTLIAQDKLPIKFGKVTVADFDVKSPLIDSNTNAVVVADVGSSEFMANTNDLNFSILFKRKVRIKILNKKGFDAANITIPLYVSDKSIEERLEDLDVYTYNLVNGKVQSTKMERSSLFTEKHNKNLIYKKFTFPALAEGSIIEYAYEIKSDFFFNFQSWIFQGDYPVLWSQYDASIPEFFKYIILSQGYNSFAVNKTDSRSVNFKFVQRVLNSSSPFEVGGNTKRDEFDIAGLADLHTWIMKDVPALKEESNITTLGNYVSKIEFQLKQIAYPNQVPSNYMNDWQKVSTDLLINENFGIPIGRGNGWLDDEVKVIVGNATTAKDKAKKIYEHIRDRYTCNNFNGRYISTSLKDVFKNKNGTVADINMLLIAMLRNQQITADPVLLGTRNHGYTSEYYPLMDRYNYVIAQAQIDGTVYYLDAATPRLAFNKLPLQAYNGQARIIDKEGSAVYFVADSISESDATSVFITNMDNKKVEGSFNNTMGYYHSLNLRNKLAKSNMVDYKKTLQETYSDEIEIDNVEIDSLKLLDEPIALKFDLKLKAFGEADIVYFNPMLGEAIRKNPYTAAERFYPIEMPYTINDMYTLNMEIPKGYKVDEIPKSARIKLNEDEGMFEYLISASAENIQMRCRVIIKKATYSKDDYQTLRDFYGFIVNKEAEQIVFKKIK